MPEPHPRIHQALTSTLALGGYGRAGWDPELVAIARLLLRLFHEETPRVWPPQKVDFGCTCSPDKVRRALHQYSAKDLGHMTTEDGKVTADCQFCGSHFEFDPDKLGFEAEE